MVKQGAVPRVDQHPGGPIDEKGITIVGGRRPPHKCMKIIDDLHIIPSDMIAGCLTLTAVHQNVDTQILRI